MKGKKGVEGRKERKLVERGSCPSISPPSFPPFRPLPSRIGGVEDRVYLQDTSHGVEDHLEHGLGTQTRPDHVGDGLNEKEGREKAQKSA